MPICFLRFHVSRPIVLPSSVCAILLSVLLGNLSRANGFDWPEFRGPTGQGLAPTTELPIRWDLSTDPTWKRETPGKGWSSPIVHRDRIYLTTAVTLGADEEDRQSLRALCLNASTGDMVWDVEVFQRQGGDGKTIHKKNSHASPTPLTDGERVYVHFGPDGTAALDLDGKIKWANREIQYNANHGGGGSPIFSGPRLVFNCDGVEEPFVIALRRDTGAIDWQTKRPPTEAPRFSFATPLEIEVAGQRQLVSPASHQVCSYDPETGVELWRVRYPNKWSIIPRPVFAHGLVFVCTGYEGPAELLAIRPDGRGDVTDTHVAWKTDENVSHSPSPVIVGDDIYMVSDNGIASCRDVKTGTLHWRHRLGGNFSASPFHSEGKIYFQSEQGTCTVIAASHEYQELAKNEFEEATLASYAVGDGYVVVRTEAHLYRIDASRIRE